MLNYVPPPSGLQLSRDAAQRYETLQAIRGGPRHERRLPQRLLLRLQHAG